MSMAEDEQQGPPPDRQPDSPPPPPRDPTIEETRGENPPPPRDPTRTVTGDRIYDESERRHRRNR
jgi:hypothetical protein